jgi:putative transposase
MQRKVVKVRLYPTNEQQHQLAKTFGAARWWWNFALSKSIEEYEKTGKGLGQSALNALLPKLKKDKETEWLGECYSQVLQATTLNLTVAYKNFFAKRAGFPRFKSKKNKQSVQYPQNVKILDSAIVVPKLGEIKAKIHRPIDGIIKTVTISRNPSEKYFASILFEVEENDPEIFTEGNVIGIDLGLTHFAIVSNGSKTSKFDNPRHLAKHERNLKRKQKKLSRKQKDGISRQKYRKFLAKVHERVSNSRQDFLHKLSRKLVDENQVIVVENLYVLGMVRNHKLAKAISDVGWGMFVNFLDYKLQQKGGKLVEIDRWFPSSKLCSHCFYQVEEMPLEVREWTCPNCNTKHDRDGNAAYNIRAEGIRLLWADGAAVPAVGGEVRPMRGRKSKLRHSLVSTEAPPSNRGNEARVG